MIGVLVPSFRRTLVVLVDRIRVLLTRRRPKHRAPDEGSCPHLMAASDRIRADSRERTREILAALHLSLPQGTSITGTLVERGPSSARQGGPDGAKPCSWSWLGSKPDASAPRRGHLA